MLRTAAATALFLMTGQGAEGQECFFDHPVCAPPCPDEYSGAPCRDWLQGYDCEFLSSRGACECTCQGQRQPSGNSGECTSSPTGVPCYSPLAEWQKTSILDAHNTYRNQHGVPLLQYDEEVASWALNSEGFRITCETGSLTHNDPPRNGDVPYGENLAKVLGGNDLHKYDPAFATYQWYCTEAGCWDFAAASKSVVGAVTGHFTQVIWRGTTHVGCALCHRTVDSFTGVFTICNYRTPGNVGGQYAANLPPPSDNLVSLRDCKVGLDDGPTLLNGFKACDASEPLTDDAVRCQCPLQTCKKVGTKTVNGVSFSYGHCVKEGGASPYFSLIERFSSPILVLIFIFAY